MSSACRDHSILTFFYAFCVIPTRNMTSTSVYTNTEITGMSKYILTLILESDDSAIGYKILLHKNKQSNIIA